MKRKLDDKAWRDAEDYLKELEDAYISIGSAGMFGLGIFAGLRMRLEKGERTPDLHAAIMECE